MIIEILTRYLLTISGLDSDPAALFWPMVSPFPRTGDSCGWRSAWDLSETWLMILSLFLLISILAIVPLFTSYDAPSCSNFLSSVLIGLGDPLLLLAHFAPGHQ